MTTTLRERVQEHVDKNMESLSSPAMAGLIQALATWELADEVRAMRLETVKEDETCGK